MIEYIFVLNQEKQKPVEIYYVLKKNMKPEEALKDKKIKPILKVEADSFTEKLAKKFPKPKYFVGRASTTGSVEDLIEHYFPLMDYEYE